MSNSTHNPASSKCDARGILIPDDLVKQRDRLLSDPVAFWTSSQFYVKGDPNTMLETLSKIPDPHFSHIQSLCLDFGWRTPGVLLPPGLVQSMSYSEDQSMSDSEDVSMNDSENRSMSESEDQFMIDPEDQPMGNSEDVSMRDSEDLSMSGSEDLPMSDSEGPSTSDWEDQSITESDDQFNDPVHESLPLCVKRLLDAVLEKGSDKLVVKLLWTTTVYTRVERKTEWVEDGRYWGYGGFMSHAVDCQSLREWFRTLGYNEDRVRLISRLQWRDEWPFEIDWDGLEEEKYLDCEDAMFEIDPISKESMWDENGTIIRMSYGLAWDPLDGHA